MKVLAGQNLHSFKCGDMKGTFSYGDTRLFSITLNYTTKEGLLQTLCKVAIYISWDAAMYKVSRKQDFNKTIRMSDPDAKNIPGNSIASKEAEW